MKQPITQQQRDNQLDAIHRLWPSVPPENVYKRLLNWTNQLSEEDAPDCGTVACFGGWSAHWPAFKAQGVRSRRGVPHLDEGGLFFDVSRKLFGFEDLFAPRWSHPADRGHESDTDHQIVTRRLQWAIDNSEVRE